MLADLIGQAAPGVVSIPTARDPKRFVAGARGAHQGLLADHRRRGRCEGIGVVVPGMVEHSGRGACCTRRRSAGANVDLREPLAAATGLPVQIENSGRACALAQVWACAADRVAASGNLVFVSVSDGVGVGVVDERRAAARPAQHRRRVRAHAAVARRSALLVRRRRLLGSATSRTSRRSSRYFGRAAAPAARGRAHQPFTIEDLIARARAGDGKAVAALQATARYLGLGLGAVVNTIDPDCASSSAARSRTAWDLIESTVRTALAERALTPAAAATDIVTVSAKNIRACAAPPCSSRRRRLPRRSWPEPRTERRTKNEGRRTERRTKNGTQDEERNAGRRTERRTKNGTQDEERNAGRRTERRTKNGTKDEERSDEYRNSGI